MASNLTELKLKHTTMKDKIIKILEKNASYYNQMEMAVSEELFTDVADEIVKLLATPAVSKSEGLQGRELLMAFRQFMSKHYYHGSAFQIDDIDEFLGQQ